MKKVFFLLLLFISLIAYNQNNTIDSFKNEAAFVKNHGQFNARNWQKNNKIQYAIDYNKCYVFFTEQGLSYRFDKIIRNPNRNKKHPDSPKRTNISEVIHIKFLNANPNPEITTEERTNHYYSYAIKDLNTNEVNNVNNIYGYKKLSYKNIYDNIDIEYTIHPKGGFKYSIILHPGANPSDIKMKYINGHTKVANEKITYELDELGQLKIETSLADITEHKPYTFYKHSHKEISSNFIFENDILSFNLENYDKTKEIVIDPWVVSTNFNTSTAAWEVETDGTGNVYVIGGETPMVLRKYNSTGTMQWTYNTPWDTASVWLGTLATDNTGESYITSGTTPEIERVSTAGAMVWHNNTTTGGLNTEYWSITFNCDKTKLIVGGTGGNLTTFSARIYDIDINNGNVLNDEIVHTGTTGGMMGTPIEVRSISSSKDAKYIFLTHEDVGAILDNIGACPTSGPIFKVPNGHNLGYKCENYLPATQNGGGLKALIANDQFIYTHSGDEIHKRLLNDGSFVTSVNLPGGNSSTVPIVGGIVVENSGLAVDDCGNVYAGSGNQVVKFDQDLNILQQSNVGFTVYDVSVNSNGEVLACGAQSDNSSTNRNGQVESINMNACPQFSLICCDANICPVQPLCDTDPSFNLVVSTPGGTFSGTGITNTTNGTFDPSVAGVGTFTVYYTLPCGMDSTTIIVDACLPVEVCYNGTDLVATGGTGTIIWEDWETYNYPITNEQECIDCPSTTPQYAPIIGTYIGCSANTCSGTGWVQIGTGPTLAPPTNWPLQISDDNGVALTYNNLGEIPLCGACTPPSLSQVVTHVTCAGGNDGAINLTITPGSGTIYTSSWTGPSGFTSTNEDISGLQAGNYSITVTDAGDPSCTATLTITVNDGAPIDNPSFTVNDFCDGAVNSATITGTAGGSFSFNPIPTGGETINPVTGEITGGIGGNTYTIEYTTNGTCPASSTQTLTVNANPSGSISGSTSFCTGGSTTLDAGAGYVSYNWSPLGNTQTISVNSAGTYAVTVTDNNGCTGTDQVTVSVSTSLSPSISGLLSICSGASTSLDAGAGYTTYNWSTGDITQTINVTTAGTYTVTVSDATGCSGTDNVTVSLNSNPTPSITGLLSFCTGNSTILDAGGGYVNYSWSPAATTQTISVNTAGNYSVTVTDANGCTGTDQVSVSVSPNLTPNITGTLSICAGASTLLDAGTGYNTYNWNTGDMTQTINVSTIGSYSVTVSDATGCTGTDQVNVIASSSLSISLTGTDLTCNGNNSGSIDMIYGGGTSPIDILWSNGATTQNIENLLAGTYYVTLTDAAGCSGTDNTTISEPPPVVVTPSNSQNICSGQSVTLVANASGGSAPYTYYWGGTSSGQAISVTPSVQTTYQVYVMDANGCISATETVTIYVLEGVNMNLQANNDHVCPGDEVLITPDITPGIPPYSVYDEMGNLISPPYIVYPTDTTTYTLTIIDQCGSSSTNSITIYTDSLPPVFFSADTLSGCQPLTVAFNSQYTAQSYIWNFGEDDMNNLSFDNAPIHTYDDPGLYSVSLTVTNDEGCTNSLTIEDLINVYENPVASFTNNPEAVSIIKPIVYFYNLSSGHTTSFWDFGDNSESTAENPHHEYPIYPTGTYTIQLIVESSRGCLDTVYKEVIVFNEYTFYAPNAFSPDFDGINDIFHVYGNGVDSRNFQMYIFDRWGEMIFESSDFYEGWNGRIKGGEVGKSGTYTWLVIYKDLQGIEHEEAGAVSIIR